MPLSRVPDASEAVGDHAASVRIVLIPGLGPQGPPAIDWGLCGDAWQEILSAFGVRTAIYQLDHRIAVDGNFNYQSFIHAGEALQDRLVQMCKFDMANQNQPIIFIAHSFGGSILKQALFYLNGRATSSCDAEYSRILNLIAGIVFISSPHGAEQPEKLKKHTCFLLNLCAKGAAKNQILAAADETFPDLHSIHERYGKVGFRFDTLSLVESDPCVWKKVLVRSKQLRIVDESIGRIDGEAMIALEGDHFATVSMSKKNGQPDQEVVAKLKAMLEAAPTIVADRMQTHVSRMSSPSIQTQASFEAMRKAFSETSTQVASTSLATQRTSPTFNKDMDIIFEKFTPTQLQVRLPCFMMDSGFPQNPEFFGRADVLGTISDHLLPDPKAVSQSVNVSKLSVVVLCGMAGLGKTEIAMHFAFSQKSQFDAVFWVCADNDTKLEADFCQIGIDLGLHDGNDQATTVISKNKVKDWLSNPKKILNGSDDLEGLDEATWLLIFDNADSPAILRDYLPEYGRGSILITSRDLAAKDCHPDAEFIDLAPLQEDEAIQFLNHLTKNAPDNDGDLRLARHFDGLPLAIAQMAGIMRENLGSYEDLLESLEDPQERLELYSTSEGGVNRTARGNMASIWAINKLTADARSLIEIISLLFPDTIPEELLLQRQNEKMVLPMKRWAFTKARGQLLHLSLIKRNDEKGELWIHRVPRQVIRANMESSSKLKAFTCALDLVQQAWPVVEYEKRHNKATVPERERLLPHVMSLKQFYEEEWRVKDAKIDFTMASLLQEAAWFMYERGNLARARPLGLLALRITSSPTIEADPRCPGLVSNLHDILGCVGNGTNQASESMKHNTEFLRLRKQIANESGVEDFPLAYAHNQMGCAWMMAKDYKMGSTLFTEALRIWHAHPNFKKGLASMEYANLGLAHWLLGDLDEASRVLEEGLEEREAGFGIDNPESFRPGRILHALGNVRFSQSRFEESEEYHHRALKLYIKAVGPQYHRVADVCHRMAQHCLRRRDAESLEKAVKLLDQALAIWGADSNTYKPEIARTTFFKSKVLFQLSSHGGSDLGPGKELELFANAVEMFHELSPDSPKEPEDLTEGDFDALISFWSR